MINQPPVFVLGEKVGQKVYPPGTGMHAGPTTGQSIPPGMMPYNAQAMVAQQNANMEMLERRRDRERAREAAANVGSPLIFIGHFANSILASASRGRRFSG